VGGEPDKRAKEGPAHRDLAAAIHETTNALTVILGWIERATETSRDNPNTITALNRAARYARTARDSMRRAIGAYVAEQPPERAGALVDRTAEDLAVEARRASVVLEHSTANDWADRLVAHPHIVWRVLTNLLLNAIAMTPEGGRVQLLVTGDGDRTIFRVCDEGPGIAPEERSRIFDGTTCRRAGGAGIGLRHAQALATSLGGELHLLESEPDQGTCFELLWPVGEEEAPAARPPSVRPSGAALSGTHVLLLEDDAAVVQLLELSLGARGAEVTSVTTAADLGSELDSGRYDVMLVDLSPLSPDAPPQEDSGLDAAVQRARAANPAIDVVVISGSVTVQPRPDVVWVRKPFEPGELVDAIVKNRRSHPS